MIEKSKICSRCKEDKPYTEYGRDYYAKDELRSDCKKCRNSNPNKIKHNVNKILTKFNKQDIINIDNNNNNKEEKMRIKIHKEALHEKLTDLYFYKNKTEYAFTAEGRLVEEAMQLLRRAIDSDYLYGKKIRFTDSEYNTVLTAYKIVYNI